ncbi:MAG: hypothetical protein WBM14_04615 [Terracidiphilus sp.]
MVKVEIPDLQSLGGLCLKSNLFGRHFEQEADFLGKSSTFFGREIEFRGFGGDSADLASVAEWSDEMATIQAQPEAIIVDRPWTANSSPACRGTSSRLKA